MSKIYQVDEIEEAAKALQQGELVAFPTETVYGLGADATNPEAVKKVYQAKGRPSDNPLIVHVTSPQEVEKFALIDDKSRQLMDRFWPGPLTIILPIKKDALSSVVTGGLATAAFRNPENKLTLNLIQTAGVPLVGPSANTSGKPSPTKASHVMHDLDGKIAGVLDGGETKIGVESTVIDMAGNIPTILRPGAITPADLEPILGEVQTDRHQVGQDEVPKAPGMKYKHYAPNAQVYIVEKNQWMAVEDWIKKHDNEMVGVLVSDQIQTVNKLQQLKNVELFSLGADVNSASQHLFAGLRNFDQHHEIKTVFAQAFEPVGLGEAYMNRLKKSAGNTYFRDLK